MIKYNSKNIDKGETWKVQKNVLFIKTNLLAYDPRLKKEIWALQKNGYNISLLCWDRDLKNESSSSSQDNSLLKEMIFKFKAPYGAKILLYLPFWWCFEFWNLLRSDADVIHAINLDSIIPAIIVGMFKGVPVIYELFDVYEDEIILPKYIRSFFLRLDKLCMFLSHLVILVDESRIIELVGVPNNNVVIIYNSPPDFPEGFQSQTKKNLFIVFFAGLINTSRSIEETIQAVLNMQNVKFIIAGFGDLEEKISKISTMYPDKIEFIGRIDYRDVLKISLSSDVLISFYDPSIPLNKYASSNKLFEAMMCGKPIIVNDCSSMADIVRQENCGLVVPFGDISVIREAILTLKSDQNLNERLGRNGRRAYEEKYSWSFMETRLLDIYERLTRGKNR